MRKRNFETVSVSEILRTKLCPDSAMPAPYVLIVDDEHEMADTLGLIFRSQGYAVIVAYDAESALDISELAPPQVLVTDVGLPGMDGVDLAFRLQQTIPDCAVVLVTGMPERVAQLVSERPRHRCRMFAKPIEPAELLHCISELLARSEVKNHDRLTQS